MTACTHAWVGYYCIQIYAIDYKQNCSSSIFIKLDFRIAIANLRHTGNRFQHSFSYNSIAMAMRIKQILKNNQSTERFVVLFTDKSEQEKLHR